MDKMNVLLVHDMVLFPNSEIRIECDNANDQNIINLIDKSDDQLVLIVNPIIDDLQNITSLPNVGVVGQIKLKMDVPNGKTRIVLSGLKRVFIDEYKSSQNEYEAVISDICIDKSEEEDNYKDILIKAIEKYINSVPYMTNAILSKIPSISSLDELCDLIGTFVPFSYEKKKK